MVVEFTTAFPSHTFPEVYEMPAQMFFVYYSKIPTAMAIDRIQYVESHLLAKARQWADNKTNHKVEREYKRLQKLAEGKS
jgi:hypothetical protein